jgi:pimeloyl-ACP methyl ester carboxylesterase
VHLAGTLTVPEGPGPFPAVLLITGSGSQDRDETIFEHKPFLVLADDLTRRGIAVLRVDDRGVGGSTGGSPNDTTADFATDVEAGVAWLKACMEVDPKRIGLIGHSEGGVIAPMVAARDPAVAFVVLWAGSGVRGAELLAAQARAVAVASGAPPAAADEIFRHQSQMLQSVAGAPDAARARAALVKVAADADLPPPTDEAIASLTVPWTRWFIAYDPAPALRALKIPVLALIGGKDVQVLPEQNIPALRAALAGDAKAQVLELPGLNHLFQTAGTGGPAEYGKIEETIAPAALKLIGDWIVGVVGPPAR